jgi:hypothetical protein
MPVLSLWCVNTLEPDLVLSIIGIEHHDGISIGDMNNATLQVCLQSRWFGEKPVVV